jgi:hypothetical protein
MSYEPERPEASSPSPSPLGEDAKGGPRTAQVDPGQDYLRHLTWKWLTPASASTATRSDHTGTTRH